MNSSKNPKFFRIKDQVICIDDISCVYLDRDNNQIQFYLKSTDMVPGIGIGSGNASSLIDAYEEIWNFLCEMNG